MCEDGILRSVVILSLFTIEAQICICWFAFHRYRYA